MSRFLPLKESSRELIIALAQTLRPQLPEIVEAWRKRLEAEFGFSPAVLATLEKLSLAGGCEHLCRADFESFQENLSYYGTRLAKLQTDTRHVARSLEIFQELCQPCLAQLEPEQRARMSAALEMLSSASLVAVTGAYCDTRSIESATLLSVLDAELSARTLPLLLERVLQVTTASFGATLGAVLLREADSDVLRIRALTGVEWKESADIAVPLGQGFSGKIAATGEPELLLASDVESRVLLPALRERAKSLWGVPLKTASETIGVLVIGFEKPYEWLPTERELMRAIAERSALAIERAGMTEALREREARIAELSGYLLRAQEQERRRVSRELHDETGQGLMVIRLYLGMLEESVTGRTAKTKIRETLAVVDRTIEGIRRILGGLTPLVLQELGLIAAVRKEAKDLAKGTGVKARVSVAQDVGRLAPDTEAALYRVVQEALHNVAKHARANTVNIHIGRINGRVRLSVQDDGVGMSARVRLHGSSFGLAGIAERISMMGGTVDVSSRQGQGTRVEVVVPAPPWSGNASYAVKQGVRSSGHKAARERQQSAG